MKRSWVAVSCTALLAIGAVALYAENSSTLTIEPSQMRDGETKTFTDDGKTITVKREANTTTVRIDGADKTDRVTITRDGNRIRIGHAGEDGFRSFVVGPDRHRIVIDGVPLDEFNVPSVPRFRTLPRETSTYYVCPKDHTMLRVPDGKEDQTFKCPVDGTTMEKRKGRGFMFFYDDSSMESHVL